MAATDTAWPADLSMPDAASWQDARAYREWCEVNGVPSRDESTPDKRRCRAIADWAHAHHPSPRWPAFIDQHWMNASGLRAVQQRAERDGREDASPSEDTRMEIGIARSANARVGERTIGRDVGREMNDSRLKRCHDEDI